METAKKKVEDAENMLREALADLSRAFLTYGPGRGIRSLLESTVEEKLVHSFKELELARVRKEELRVHSPQDDHQPNGLDAAVQLRMYLSPRIDHEYAIPPYVGPLRAMLWNFCSLIELVEAAKGSALADGAQFPLPAGDTLLYGERVAGYVARNMQYGVLCRSASYPDALWTGGASADVPVESTAFMAEITRVKNLLCARGPAAGVAANIRAFDGMTNKTRLSPGEILQPAGFSRYGVMYAKHCDGIDRAYLVARLDYPDTPDRYDMLFVSNVEPYLRDMPDAPLNALVVLAPAIPPAGGPTLPLPEKIAARLPNPVAGPGVRVCFAM